jgi:hypothetical protein
VTMRLTSLSIVLAAAATSAALTGCGAAAHFVPQEDMLDSGKLENNVAALVADRYRVPAGTVRVDCPGKIPAYRGTKVECEAASHNGRTARVLVTITSNDIRSLKFDAAIVGNVNAPMVERSLLRRAARRYGIRSTRLAVTCPDGVHAEQGVQLTCRVRTDDGRSGRVRLTLTSGTGKRLAYDARFTRVTRT